MKRSCYVSKISLSYESLDMSKKILIVFGTRPEAIKLAPVIYELKKRTELKTLVCVFRQHKETLDQVLKTFGIKPDFDLPISISDKDLLGGGVGIFKKVKTLLQSGFGFLRFLRLLKREKPDLFIVQGDTSTVFLGGFLAFMFKVPIAHVEAGLRTYDKYAPFPEEMNRQLLGRLADIHFAPTEEAKKNLLKENVPPEKIYVVGNTEIDALLWILERQKDPKVAEKIEKDLKDNYGLQFDKNKKIILVTAHRRESFGEGLKNICKALKEIAEKRDDVLIVYPAHPNPNVREVVFPMLGGQGNIILTEPISYESFAYLMNKAYLVLTDSGGIQEAAPSLNKPLLVMREKTERQEGVEVGVSKLVGTDKDLIVKSALELLENKEIYPVRNRASAFGGSPKDRGAAISNGVYNSMINKENPYGDGTASVKIAKILGKI